MKRIIILIALIIGYSNSFSGTLSKTVSENQWNSYLRIKKQMEIDKEITRRLKIVDVHCFIESSFNELAYTSSENAIGILQIRPIMIKEINIYTNYNLKHSDCWDREISEEAFIAFQNHFNPTWDEELAARRWNGGRQGENKTSTLGYWKRIKERLEV